MVGWATGFSLPTNSGYEWWANKRTFAHPTRLERVPSAVAAKRRAQVNNRGRNKGQTPSRKR
jgi:hypothetical protein